MTAREYFHRLGLRMDYTFPKFLWVWIRETLWSFGKASSNTLRDEIIAPLEEEWEEIRVEDNRIKYGLDDPDRKK